MKYVALSEEKLPKRSILKFKSNYKIVMWQKLVFFRSDVRHVSHLLVDTKKSTSLTLIFSVFVFEIHL